MPLYRNPFQPYFTDQDAPAPESCGSQYCYPVAPGNPVMQEFYQTPCSGSLVEDDQFEDSTLGPELITNGTFTTVSAPWVLGTDWVYAGGGPGLDYVFYSSNGLDYLQQTGFGLATGNIYRVTFDVTIASGGMQFMLGFGTGATVSDIIYTTGSYSFDMLFNDTNDLIQFFPGAYPGNNVFLLDNVSVKLLTMADWENPDSVFSFGDGKACKIITGAGVIYNGSSDYIDNGDYYKVQATVSGYGGSGTAAIYIDDGTGSTATNTQTSISANGIYTYYITASQDGVIGFSASTDFTGCVSSITVERLRNNFVFSLINSVGDVLDISYLAEYFENRILLSINFDGLLESGDIEYGCFTVGVTDACLVEGADLVTDGDFTNGSFTNWLRNNGASQYAMSAGQLQFIFEPLSGLTKVVNGDFSGGAASWTLGANWAISGGGAQHTAGSVATLSQSITISSPAVPPSFRRWWVQFTISGRTAGSVTATLSNVTGPVFNTNEVITFPLDPTIGGVVNLIITPTSDFDGKIDDVGVWESSLPWSGNISILNIPVNPDYVAGNYELEYTIAANTRPADIAVSLALEGQAEPAIYSEALATYQRSITNYIPGGQRVGLSARFREGNNWYPGRITVDNVSAVRVEPFEATFTSECLNFQSSHPGTTLVTGWCDNDALGSDLSDNLGFSTSGYILQMRVESRGLNAVFPTQGNNAFFSNGNAAQKYAQIAKYWQFSTGFIPESALAALAAMVRCNHFTIGEAGIGATEYLAEMEDVIPLWRSEADSNLSTANLSVTKKTGSMKFIRHT